MALIPSVTSPPLTRIVSPNQDHYGVPLLKYWCIIHLLQELNIWNALKINFITILVLNLITEFWAKDWEVKQFAEANTHRTKMTPCTRDADLKNGSRREGEREHTCKTTSRQSLSNESSARLTRQRGYKQPIPSMQGLWDKLYTVPKPR
jgi:hypothetical protein